MTYKVVYFDEVRQDIKEAKRWYRKQSSSLEKRFANDIKNILQHISVYPYSCAIRYKKIRIAHPYIFPVCGSLLYR